MPIDVKQFQQTFIDESLEMLQEAEGVLLNFDVSIVNQDHVHKIFRILHSIKGASAVFKLDAISELAHTLENYLDKVRSNSIVLKKEDIDLLLKAIDCIHSMIIALQNKSNLDTTSSKSLNDIFKEKLVNSQNTGALDKKENLTKEKLPEPVSPAEEVEKIPGLKGWEIIYKPPIDSFQLNNEPLRIFTALSELGKLEIKVDITNLPSFKELNPSQCYISWNLKIYTEVTKADIKEIFSWVTNPENVVINPIIAKAEQASGKANLFPVAHSTSSVRVATDKIDSLINLIGELVITNSMLNQIIENFDVNRLNELKESLGILESNSRQLQEHVMRIRMVPIEFVFTRFSRLVYDLAQKMGKKVELVVTGEQTEIDKNMIEKISDPLLHLIRNALDHGIESPAERQAQNKNPIGTITLNAYQEANNIVIDVTDDGNGLNKEKIRKKALQLNLINQTDELTDDKLYQLIFSPGFSTVENISDISGRGVGLDVVYKNISDLGGEVQIETEQGQGTTFRLRLPLTLAIMDCQLVRVSGQIFIIPLINITEIIRIKLEHLQQIDAHTTVYDFDNNYIPLIQLNTFFGIKNDLSLDKKSLIVVRTGNKIAGLVIDELLSQQQVVIKNIEDNYKKIPGISGVTILGNGKVALIVDVKAIIEYGLNFTPLTEKNQDESAILQLNSIHSEDKNIHESHEPFHFLSFIMGTHEFGVDILAVKEIRQWEDTTLLPNSPSFIKGIINVRGNMIPILDLYSRFDIDDKTFGTNKLIIILMIKSAFKVNYFGLIADQVSNTYTIHYRDIKPVLNDGKSAVKNYLYGFVTIEEKMIAIFNPNYLSSLVTEQEKVS